ncbi:UNVERIFIED_CONTAM: hypothetical protein RMT77_012840 [Armadillidium vulgare]
MNNQRPQFGNRFLTDKSDVFTHNAWDNVEWDEEQECQAKEKVFQNSDILLSESEIKDLDEKASIKWDEFYSIHQNRFFKDRHWLFTEFSELESISKKSEGIESSKSDSESKGFIDNLERLRLGESFAGENSTFKILEVGCGVGNTVFPILETNIDPNLFVYCCDFSTKAIDIVKESENYNPNRCFAFVCDVASEDWPEAPFPRNSLDIIVCIFVLSALQPLKIRNAIRNLSSYLKPGGILLFRDYGRYDMAQLRFKKGRCLGDNFYARGDGTRCYFFTQEEVREMMTEAGLEEVQNVIDRRLQVNRGKQLKMFRVWIQGKYKKTK